MKKVTLSPTQVLKYETCPHQYKLAYVDGIRETAVGHALPFGSAGHLACLGALQARVAGDESYSPVETFAAAWSEALASRVITFSRYTAEQLNGIGQKLASQFLLYWDNQGWQPLINTNGALVEARMKLDIGEGVEFSAEADVLARDGNGKLGILDLKFPSAKSWDGFAKVSDQLTAYEIAVDAHRQHLGVSEPVTWLGFLEGQKTTKPSWSHQTAPSRSDVAKQEYLAKVRRTADLIREGYFPKRSAAAYNSPCSLCEFRAYCMDGDDTGLIFPSDEPIKVAA